VTDTPTAPAQKLRRRRGSHPAVDGLKLIFSETGQRAQNGPPAAPGAKSGPILDIDASAATSGPPEPAVELTTTGEVLPAPRYDVAQLARYVTFDPAQLSASPRAGITFEIWAEIVAKLTEANKSVPWYLADLLAFGEDAYGEDAAAVLETSQWAYQTMANYASTARRVTPERRRADLTFAHHAEVAALEPDQQIEVLEAASDNGWSRDETREQVRALKRAQARERALAAPVPPAPLRCVVQVGDATQMDLPDSCVGLICTSPPYDLEQPYEGAMNADAWRVMLEDFANEAYRVLVPSGRIALNVPIDATKGGYRPTQAQATLALLRAGFVYASTIIWHDGTINKTVARGSVDSPSAPRIQTPAEAIIIASKGPWRRPPQRRTSHLTHEEWLAWTNGYWAIPGESNPWEGRAAAYPLEVPYRLIKLLAYAEDTVLDPFCGSGTTLVAAYRLGQAKAIGLDTDPDAVDSTLRRLALAQVAARGEAFGGAR